MVSAMTERQAPWDGRQSDLTVDRVRVRTVQVPLRFALGTSADVLRRVPLVLIDLHMAQGVTGRAYVFAYTPAGATAIAALVAEAVATLRGQPAAPVTLGALLARRYRLAGVTGAVRMALSMLDVALWDAQAVARGQSLAALLGARRGAVAAYDSRGLGLDDPGPLADEAARLVADGGLGAIKLRLGHPTLAADLAAIRAVRDALPPHVGLMVDYNQALPADEALRRGRALDDLGLLWIEEPVRHDDYPALARLAAALRTPVQIGENFNGPEAMQAALAADACDLAMPDVARIGGVTGWRAAADLAAARGVPLSSHLYPEISAALLAASPTAQWVEHVDWADAILACPLRPAGGALAPAPGPGAGLAWDEDRLRHLGAV